jgi:hypothetical protein
MTKKKIAKKVATTCHVPGYHMCTNTHTSHFNTLEQPRTTIIHVSSIKNNQISFTNFLLVVLGWYPGTGTCTYMTYM